MGVGRAFGFKNGKAYIRVSEKATPGTKTTAARLRKNNLRQRRIAVPQWWTIPLRSR